MTDLFKQAVDTASKLPDEQQDSIAALIFSAINGKRPLGLARGLGEVADDFNEPMPDDELALWYEDQEGDPLSS